MENNILEFNGYSIETAEFKKVNDVENFDSDEEVRIELKNNINKKNSNQFIIIMGANISNKKFNMEVEISGEFTLKVDDDSFIKQNALAILFPFLRSTVASFCGNMQISPVILPILDFVKLSEQ